MSCSQFQINVAFITMSGIVPLLQTLKEVPGGKVEPGETPQAALVREIQEELDTQIEEQFETIEE